MAVCCQSRDCGRAAPADLQWRPVLAFSISDIVDLFTDKFDAFDCPHCGAQSSIHPSLAGVFTVEAKLLLVDRGFDAEPVVRTTLAPLVAATKSPLVAEQVRTLDQFKDVFAAKVKATARTFPYGDFTGNKVPQDLANWRSLQGEILTAFVVGALDIVPHFGVHAATPDGEKASVEATVKQIENLTLRLLTSWSLGLPTITRQVSLEEVLIRLIDSCGVIALLRDRAIDRLAASRRVIDEKDLDFWIRFHYCAIEATVYGMLGKDNPHADEWAAAYLMVRRTCREGELGEEDRFLLGARRLATTIPYEHAWNAVAASANSILKLPDPAQKKKELQYLEEAADDLGYPGLLEAVIHSAGQRRKPTETAVPEPEPAPDPDPDPVDKRTPEWFAARIVTGYKDGSLSNLGETLRLLRPPWYSDPETVARFFDLLEPATKANPEEQAALLTWFGERMKLLGAPKPVLARMGAEPAPWEARLSNVAQRRLWTERSNALRLAGNTAAALKVAEATLRITEADSDAPQGHKATAWMNYGILLRENGQFAKAEQCLLQAISLTSESQRWSPLHSLSSIFVQTGRPAEAADVLAEARKTAGGPDLADVRLSLLLTEVAIRMQLGQRERAETLLAKAPSPETMPDQALVSYTNILKTLVDRPDGFEKYRPVALALLPRLMGIIDKFEAVGNHVQAQGASHGAAEVAEAFALPEAEELWYRDAAISLKAGRLPDPRTAIELAIYRLRENPETFRERILMIPGAIAQRATGISLNAESMDVLSPLDGPFERLAMAVYEKELGPGAIQLVAELRRNAHSRAIESASGDGPGFSCGLQIAATMRSDDTPFIVLEWCEVPDGLLGLVTFVAGGDGQAQYISKSEELDLIGTAEKIGTRLENWRSGRKGQPYDALDWELIKQGLRIIAATYLPEGGHVVVIDEATLSGFPFHIALAPEWTVSYSSDWLAIEAAVKANGDAPSRPRLGVLHAPRSNETVAVRAALLASDMAMRDIAKRKGLDCDHAEPGSADAAAFRRLLDTSDALKVLCHGQVTKEDHEVVLLIDHDGRPPPGYSFGVMLETAQGHRFGRKQLGEQTVAPRTLFLGACSGGFVSVAGLDERTSFASMLARAGTKSVLAPRWKIDAELALPVLDDVIARFVDGEPLAKAVLAAAEAAIKRGVPEWQAHAFTIEGAWI
ncbi:CHAT domain-containing protein [Bradyrhizobium sp. Arg816]|uniref:CHAT domain-containing protein n=1 Tax=Bradyrhizobium sp. Arg816 TaxID=2998491 RepID=UPI00249DF71C|nr:CHAT domain-containing protein [Bradyrhizobium sp. Arg816]MDI3561746.1 CHAT domain-containing protein [Bradyrhizobium sp. Arg816]